MNPLKAIADKLFGGTPKNQEQHPEQVQPDYSKIGKDEDFVKRVDDTEKVLAAIREGQIMNWNESGISFFYTVHEEGKDPRPVRYEITNTLFIKEHDRSIVANYGDIHPLSLPFLDVIEYMDTERVIMRIVTDDPVDGPYGRSTNPVLEFTPNGIKQL